MRFFLEESLLKRFDTTGKKMLGQYDFYEPLGCGESLRGWLARRGTAFLELPCKLLPDGMA